MVADTVGGVPNLRLKDNLFQLAAVVVTVALGVGIGVWVATDRGEPWWMGAMVGALLGFIVGGVLSGMVLMVVGWIRALKARDKR